MSYAARRDGSAHRVGLIGLGRIGKRILRYASGDEALGTIAVILVKPGQVDAARETAPGTVIASSVHDFLAAEPDLVVECAGADCLRDVAAPILSSGADMIALSLAAFIDDAFEQAMLRGRPGGGGRLVIAPGAIGTLDMLGAARESGLSDVLYRSAKPVRSWRGSAAAKAVDLERLTAPAIVFQGTAREAARLFPRNANVTAAIALAGVGLDHTRVEMIADPALDHVTHHLSFACGAARAVTLDVTGQTLSREGDPADLTTFSVLRLMRRHRAATFI